MKIIEKCSIIIKEKLHARTYVCMYIYIYMYIAKKDQLIN